VPPLPVVRLSDGYRVALSPWSTASVIRQHGARTSEHGCWVEVHGVTVVQGKGMLGCERKAGVVRLYVDHSRRGGLWFCLPDARKTT